MAKDKSDTPQIYVGIGASAGGLAALKELLPNLPIGRGFTYVLIQHMDPTHPSTLDQILRHDTRLTIVPATQGVRLKVDHLYISPSDKDCRVVDGTLQLDDVHVVGPRHSVDLLLSSIAAAHGKSAAGIVLSGTGADGQLGAHELKAAQALVLVQDPEDAEHVGMPSAVIDARLADIVAPASQLGERLADVVSKAGRLQLPSPKLYGPDMQSALIQLLLRKTGFAFDQYKESTLNRRIARRIAVNDLETIEDYFNLVEASETEANALLKEMQISVTGFFRDKDVFKALAKVIKEIVSRKKAGDSLRIWVPGCATGEEPFSIGMLVADALGDRLSTINVQIFATDVDSSAIEQARKSLYLRALVDNVPSRMREKYFETIDGTCKVSARIRDLVVFAEHDLMRDPPFGRLDLVSCRNVLIYFKRPAQDRLLKTFHYALDPGGYLLLGPSEGIRGVGELFSPLDAGSRIYVRADSEQSPLAFVDTVRRDRSPRGAAQQSSDMPIEALMQQALFEQYAPPGILVDSRFDIIHLHGELAPFMRLPQGDITVNALELVIPPLRLELRLLLQKAQRKRTRLNTRPVEVTIGDVCKQVALVALPVAADRDGGPHTLVLFEVHEVVQHASRGDETSDDQDMRVRELEQELVATRDHLLTNIAELGAVNEELQSMTEEFQSTTEELQSANEEFQTTNEELQSTNEELHTVNDELKGKTRELESTNADLEGILNTVVEGIVVLDKDLRVTRYSAGAKNVLDLLPTSIGQPLVAVGGAIDLTLLSAEISKAAQMKNVVETELELGDKVYVVRLIPGAQSGLIISFTDETERIRINREAMRLATVVRDSNDAITVQDGEGRFLAWNRGAERLYGYTEAEALSMNSRQLLPKDADGQGFEFVAALMAGKANESFETRRRAKDGREKDIWVTATALRDENGTPYAVATTERDLTERKKAEKIQRKLRAKGRKDARERLASLTAREREIMAMLVAGSGDATSRAIGAKLGISARTVDTHRRNIKKKMDARSMPDLVEVAKQCGIYRPTPA
jgi:two-component system CheB/CheR fusion protein